jgi:hypothetical protein
VCQNSVMDVAVSALAEQLVDYKINNWKMDDGKSCDLNLSVIIVRPDVISLEYQMCSVTVI